MKGTIMNETGVTRSAIRSALVSQGLMVNKVGKVRVMVEVGGGILLMVASDEVSAFDWNQTPAVPGKGKILTDLSLLGLQFAQGLGLSTHLISGVWDEIVKLRPTLKSLAKILAGRSILVRKVEALPVECVVRGYLLGSALTDYQKTGLVCGIKLPEGLQLASPLEPPIFTPATKARQGLHDENVSFGKAVEILGRRTAVAIRERSLMLYSAAALWALRRGISLLDTKYEFGRTRDGKLILIDEVHTPDSSRFSPAAGVVVGRSPVSWDKQNLRDWLTQFGWNKNSPPPRLPDEVVSNTRKAYLEAYRHLMGREFVA